MQGILDTGIIVPSDSLVPCRATAFGCRAVYPGQPDSGVHSRPEAGSADDLMSLGQRRDIPHPGGLSSSPETRSRSLCITSLNFYLNLTMGPISQI